MSRTIVAIEVTFMPVPLTLLLFTYPFVVHLSVYFEHPAWAVYFLAILFALPLINCVIKSRLPSLLGSLSITASLFAIWLARSHPENLLFAQPVIINALICMLFLSTLVGDSVPIITRLAIIMKPDSTDKVRWYTRWVTWAWAIFFLTMAIISLVLAFYATIQTWSLFTNFVTYILIGAMFVLEYAARKIIMKEQIDRSFMQFLRDLKQVDYGKIAREWRS